MLRIAFLSSAVLELFSALGVAMVAVYVGFHLLGTLTFGAWGGQLSLGQGLFILLLAPAFFEPLRDFSAAWHDRAAGQAAFAALEALAAPGLPLPAPAGEARASGRAALRPMCGCGASPSTMRGARGRVFLASASPSGPGERVALLGPSGCGKTTLLSLIAGLAPVEAGQISIGGCELNEASADGLRRRMAWVGQKPHIFAGSIRANVAMGREEVDADLVSVALAEAALGGTFRADVGEGGLGLSGGEGRRLALARAAAHPDARWCWPTSPPPISTPPPLRPSPSIC